jgi:hypothetical protein
MCGHADEPRLHFVGELAATAIGRLFRMMTSLGIALGAHRYATRCVLVLIGIGLLPKFWLNAPELPEPELARLRLDS